MSDSATATNNRVRRRFARLPHDRATEEKAHQWYDECSLYKAIELLLPAIERGAYLAHGKWNGRSVATLTREGEHPDQLCNAVSGWGKTPAQALQDLAFRWCVLCQESWITAHHIHLLSEVD